RLLKFYESLTQSAKYWIAKWTAGPKSPEARTRRARQIAERLMETLEAEKDLPPMIELALRQNPRVREKWDKTSPSHRRAHLMAIFHYRTPEARMRRLNKCMEELLGLKTKKSKAIEDESSRDMDGAEDF
ncbi:MAG TPA: YdeI/OmpD-associated family protein, partial [Candidatus Angelobacter sp.]|nr:YdeI/OmpD-associated family protein [Candidatus Angelobacter sp.]